MRSVAPLALALLLTACDPVWGVQVEVRDPSGQAIEDALLAITVCEGAERSAAVTDETGRAKTAGPGIGPRPCLVTVAKPGYRSEEISLAEVCGPELAECEPMTELEVVLEPL